MRTFRDCVVGGTDGAYVTFYLNELISLSFGIPCHFYLLLVGGYVLWLLWWYLPPGGAVGLFSRAVHTSAASLCSSRARRPGSRQGPKTLAVAAVRVGVRLLFSRRVIGKYITASLSHILTQAYCQVSQSKGSKWKVKHRKVSSTSLLPNL